MPLYEYLCRCGKHEELVMSMKDDIPASLPCACGKEKGRVFSVRCHADRYTTPIVSDALAMNPNQIAEHKRMFPDIEVMPDGRPVFDNFDKHEAYLKATGFRKKTAMHNKSKTTKTYPWTKKYETI